MTTTIQIEGMDELIEAVGSGGGGGGGEGAVVPVPTLNDDGKVLQVVSQSQTKVAPEWTDIREVPIGGSNGQVLTKTEDGYEWANGGTTIYSIQGIVSEDSKSGEYSADFYPDPIHVSTTTRVLAVNDASNIVDGVIKPISTGYSITINPDANGIFMVFDSNPGITDIEIVFATTEQISLP